MLVYTFSLGDDIMNFQIVTDSTANIPYQAAERLGITVISFRSSVSGQNLMPPENDFDGHAFYKMIRRHHRPDTQLPDSAAYLEQLEPYLRRGQDILFISSSSGVSSVFQTAQQCADELKVRYPDCSIFLVDSLGTSLGEGLAVLKAAEWRDQGLSLTDTAEKLRIYVARMYQVFSVDERAQPGRSGKRSSVSSVLGPALQVRPVLVMDEQGETVCVQKERGRKRAIRALAKRYAELAVNPRNEIIGIAHADCEKDAKYLAKLIRRIAPPKKILTVMCEPIAGSHMGADALALFFPGGADARKV